jgi:Uncharacterised nucleotidyltransferase
MAHLWTDATWRSTRTTPGLLSVLRAALRGEPCLPMKAFEEGTIRWAVETGVGPLLVRGTAHDPEAAASPLWPLLQGATLTARLLTVLHMDAMADIIDACQGRVPPPVLLKGMSMCEAHYPEPHLRPMRDIDFLIEEDAVAAVESILSELGYHQRSAQPPAFYRTHHHIVPFVHPDTGIWVEVHRALFSPQSEFGASNIFGLDNLTAELRPCEFRGRQVRRLSDELQIVHVACHWAHGLRAVGGMIAMADLTCLLNNIPAVRWERVLKWTEASMASRHLCLLLTYLDNHRLIDLAPDILDRLRSSNTTLDHLTLGIAHSFLDRYVVNGQTFGILMGQRHFNRLWPLLAGRRLGVSGPQGIRLRRRLGQRRQRPGQRASESGQRGA